MKLITESDFGSTFHRALTDAVESSLRGIFEAKRAEMIAELEKERERVIANAAVWISNTVSIETLGNKMVVEIRKANDTK